MLTTPGRAPPTLTQTRRSARPMVALARQPGPKRPAPQLMSRARRIGPFTTMSGAGALVVADTPCRSNASSHTASTAASTTGRYSGRQPATLALLLVVASIARAAEPPPPGLGHDHPLTGRIWNVAQGRFVAMNALAAAVSAARFALLGERHDHPEHHEFQAWLLRRMLESGRRPAVAFEMLDTTQAPALARHLATSPRDAAGLGDAVGWRASGWPEWRLYQPIAEIALAAGLPVVAARRSEEHTSELQSPCNLVCRLLLEKKKIQTMTPAEPPSTT